MQPTVLICNTNVESSIFISFLGKIRSITRAKHYHLQLAAVHRALLRDRPFRSLLQSQLE